MFLTYEKPGIDHPRYGEVDYLVKDGMQTVCYKTKEGYEPLENVAGAKTASGSVSSVDTRPLYVLSFKMNGEAEEMTFEDKTALMQTQALYQTKPFITDVTVKEFKIMA